MNDKVKAVFELLEVKPNESFYIFDVETNKKYPEVYKINQDLAIMFKFGTGWVNDDIGIHEILNGKLNIVKTPQKPQLTDEQKEKLKALLVLGYKWLARDKNSRLYSYKEKPIKDTHCWGEYNAIMIQCKNLNLEDIPTVKWQDEQPTSIKDLLEE